MSSKRGRLVLERLLSSPWAITEEALEQVVAVATRTNLSPEAVAAHLGRPLENTRAVTVRDQVATLPVRGPLFRYANLFTTISGATSYEVLAQDFAQAVEDPSIRSILLAIDSPGGEVNGCSELAELIARARGQKPIVAYVSGMGTSAAYWLASAADAVVASETGILGSLGVRLAFVDTTQQDEARGIRRIEMISSQTPRKGDDDPTTDTGRAATQRLLDDLAAAFLEAVARYRGTSIETVLGAYCAQVVFVGSAAVEAGLADGLGTYETIHAELVAGRDADGVLAALTVSQPTEGGPMSQPPAIAADPAASRAPDPTPHPQAALTANQRVRTRVAREVAVSAGAEGEIVEVAEGVTAYAVGFGDAGEYRWMMESELEPVAEAEDADGAGARAVHLAAARLTAREEGAAAERARILTIITKLARASDGKTVRAALEDPTCTVEQAALRVVEAGKGTVDHQLAALAADLTDATPPAALSTDTPTGDAPDAVAARVLRNFRLITPNRAPAQRTA